MTEINILPIQKNKTLKICVSEPMLGKPKCVWKARVYFENCKQTAEECKPT